MADAGAAGARERAATTTRCTCGPSWWSRSRSTTCRTSPQYPGGLALRFARVKGYRPDKRADEADTIETVRALHAAQLARGRSAVISKRPRQLADAADERPAAHAATAFLPSFLTPSYMLSKIYLSKNINQRYPRGTAMRGNMFNHGEDGRDSRRCEADGFAALDRGLADPIATATARATGGREVGGCAPQPGGAETSPMT